MTKYTKLRPNETEEMSEAEIVDKMIEDLKAIGVKIVGLMETEARLEERVLEILGRLEEIENKLKEKGF